MTLYSAGCAGKVWLQFANNDAVFSENGFDITDNAPKRISFETSETVSAERLEAEIEIISLYNAGRQPASK